MQVYAIAPPVPVDPFIPDFHLDVMLKNYKTESSFKLVCARGMCYFQPSIFADGLIFI